MAARIDKIVISELAATDLLTYVAHLDLVGDPLQDACHARAPKILITKIRKILYVGYRRIFP